MISHLRGAVLELGEESVVLDVGGVGYEIQLAPSSLARLPKSGGELALFISESVPMYGGSTSLYGFLTRDDRAVFLAFKEMKATGAKKALEYLDKAAKSLPDFRRAVFEGDKKLLCDLFGFSKKTSERLVVELKDKLGPVPAGRERLERAAAPASGNLGRALDALAALGYTPAECRAALDSVRRDDPEGAATVEEIIRRALRSLK